MIRRTGARKVDKLRVSFAPDPGDAVRAAAKSGGRGLHGLLASADGREGCGSGHHHRLPQLSGDTVTATNDEACGLVTATKAGGNVAVASIAAAFRGWHGSRV